MLCFTPGYRSVYRDLECQIAIVTENVELQEQLKEVYRNKKLKNIFKEFENQKEMHAFSLLYM